MTNKILAKWAHFIKHEISTIVTKTPKHSPYDDRTYRRYWMEIFLYVQQMVDSRGDLDIPDHVFAG